MKSQPKPWTPKEISRLRAIAKSGKSAREASEILGRPHPGLRFKAMVEGIKFFSVKQPAGVQRRPAQRRKLARIARARA